MGLQMKKIIHLHLSDNWDGASELLVHHKSEDTQHSGTSVVQLNSTLLELGLLVELVPGGPESSVTKISGELVAESIHVLHDGNLQQTNEGEDLNGSLSGDGIRSPDGSPAVGVRVEGISGTVDVSSQMGSRAGDDVTQESKHANTSVLDLNVTETVETFLVSIIKKSKRIEESDRCLGTKLSLEGVDGRGGPGNRGRGEGGGGGQSRGNDNRLEHDRILVW